MTARDSVLELQARMRRSIIGQDDVVDRILLGLLANGNILLEGLPGLAKTRAVKSLAKNLDARMSRIQFTPDLLPSDITGSEILHSQNGENVLQFQPGPIFNNIILADEINRAPAKVQSALLEAMEERQVTVAGKTRKMEPLFIVAATQNPIEQEGTYPLPEAQMDRFLMHVMIQYPSKDAEKDVVRLVRGEESTAASSTEEAPISQEVIFQARKEIQAVQVSPALDQYIVDLIDATRHPEKFSQDLRRWIQIGASPRGGIGLDKASRAFAWMRGGDYTTPDDVRAIAHDVLRHRVSLSYDANAERVTANQVVSEVIKLVAVP
ncbi:MAG: MoxR family ATPase [Acidobacteria bacterium]|nr:MoxR family ATPase [Acidobacteriota bacterium]